MRAFEGNDRFHNVPTSYGKNRRYQWLDGGNHRLKIPAPQHVLMLAQFYPFDIPDKTHI